jgi:hypothetical protein
MWPVYIAVLIHYKHFDITVMPRLSFVELGSPKLQFGISPPGNSAHDRFCIDRCVLLKGKVCRMVTISHWVSSVTCHFRVWALEGFWHEVQNTTFIYTSLRSQFVHYLHTELWMNTTTVFWLPEWIFRLALVLSLPFSTLASGSTLLHPDLG